MTMSGGGVFRLTSSIAICLLCSWPDGSPAQETPLAKFFRMDPNIDGSVDISDAVFILKHLFGGQIIALDCEDSADANDDGAVNLSDAISVLFYLFDGWVPPWPAPPDCDVDQTEDRLGCEQFWPCSTTPPRRNSAGMDLIYVPAGTFLMGSPATERSRNPAHGSFPLLDETLHQVTLTYGFYLSATEVTQGQYLQVMGQNPSSINGGGFGKDLERPVDNVSWVEAMTYCRKLSEMDGRRYRLPTEAEWEYACRAGTQTRFYFGDAFDCLEGPLCNSCLWINEYVASCSNAFGSQHTEPVGQRKPNPWGFFNMLDNVSEWCLDWAGPFSELPVTDPFGPKSGKYKIHRGSGGVRPDLTSLRSACRGIDLPGFKSPVGTVSGNGGFRLVLETGQPHVGPYPSEP